MKALFIFSGLILLSFLISSCNEDPVNDNTIEDRGEYSIEVKYDSIRSYPGGGGIYLMKLIPGQDFAGKVMCSVICEPMLNAELSHKSFTKDSTICELILHPSASINPGKYSIQLNFMHDNKLKSDTVFVSLSSWGCNSDDAKAKLEEFKVYINQNYPQYKSIFDSTASCYSTYTNTLVVEHFTFLCRDFEVRLCYHVMMEPLDWSKLLIRSHNLWEGSLALLRETDGKITVIPVAEYPKLYGY